jgi:UMF1 family MFS transporter
MAQPQLPPPRSGLSLYFSLPVFSWALYDFANTIFSSNVITIFFPLYLQDMVGGNPALDQIASTFISYTNAFASLLLVLLSPLLGVLIDRTGQKKKYLVPFTLAAVAGTLGMGAAATWQAPFSLVGLPGSLAAVLILFVCAKLFYHSSLIFYDAMIADLGSGNEIPLISGFGVAVGYLGTLAGLTLYPLVGDAHYERAFLLSGGMYLLFSLPLFLWYRERTSAVAIDSSRSFFSGYREIAQVFLEMKAYRQIFLFMLAYFFFNDAIATAIAMMSVYAKTVVGFTTGKFILLYLVSTVSSILGSFGFGYVTRAVGAKRAVTYVAVLLFTAIVLAAAAVNETMFWCTGSLYGIAMGAMWVTSRTLIVQWSPEAKRGQFFGLFAFSGKVSAIVGPVLYGTVTLLLAETGTLASRVALGSLAVMTAIGLWIHLRIPERS